MTRGWVVTGGVILRPSIPEVASRIGLLERLPDHSVLVVIPVLGHHQMTHDLLRDLTREAALIDVVVVDNSGDYPPFGDEAILRPGRNLGWAEGTNHGTCTCARPVHQAFLWLNNDTRLSQGFVAGLLRAWAKSGAGILGPVYDCYWEHQRAEHPVAVADYRPRSTTYPVPFVDGTAMFVPAATVDTIGLLDADTFAPVGWGAEVDYSLRARAAGMTLAATRLSYLHHEKSVTGKTVFGGGLLEYAERGFPVAMAGLERKWGADWRTQAGIDPAAHQTSPPQVRRFSASRFLSSRSR
ncbi:MAG: glycosyltransferase family 2 protein [Acidimicrobiia bacterium]|nr:glycosyltransferase family 2 protein [Acidimicrobiia bacterium]